MPEIRSNPVTGDWVIIATERARRPEEFTQKKQKPPLPPLLPSALSARATRTRHRPSSLESPPR